MLPYRLVLKTLMKTENAGKYLQLRRMKKTDSYPFIIFHNNEVFDICRSFNIVKIPKSWRLGRTEYVDRMGRLVMLREYLGGRKLFGKHPLGRPRRIWEDNIKVHLRETL